MICLRGELHSPSPHCRLPETINQRHTVEIYLSTRLNTATESNVYAKTHHYCTIVNSRQTYATSKEIDPVKMIGETKLNREAVRVVERNFFRYKRGKNARNEIGLFRYLY